MSSYYVLKIQYVNRPPETRNISAPMTAVGRESGDIVLNDPQTSGRHAEILFQGGQVHVRDAGSTNGTWFNGQRLADFVLEPGQWFQVGQTTLQLMAVHGQQPAAAKTMMAMGAPPPVAPMGGMGGAPAGGPGGWSPPPPAPPHGAPPGPPLGGPPGPPAGFGGPAPGYPPAGPDPMQAPAGHGMGSPHGGYPGAPPGPPGYPGAQPQGGGYGGPPPGMGGPQPGMGGPPPGMGGPPGGGYPQSGPPAVPGSFGAPAPMGAPGYPPQQAGHGAMMGAPPPAGPLMGSMPMGSPAPFGGAGGVRPNFQASGGDLFVTFLVGGLLTSITFGIYMPWFVCKLMNFLASNTTLGPTRRGELRLEFSGKGGELFLTGFVGMLLTSITFGIYMPWFICKLIKFYVENTRATAPDGSTYRLRFDATGGELLVTFLIGGLLTAITFGIYRSWFMCKLYKLLLSRTAILENEQQIATLDFEGQGGELFVITLVGALLTMITLFIYFPWFQVKLSKFFAENLRVNVQGRMYAGTFHGTGGELFVINLIGGLLIPITLGIYAAWFQVRRWKFEYNNYEFREIGAAPAGMFQPNMPMQY